jgi:Rrf2 family protein
LRIARKVVVASPGQDAKLPETREPIGSSPGSVPKTGKDPGHIKRGEVRVKLITRDADYAIRALCCIAMSKEKIISARDLKKSLNIPRPFLRKILQVLTKKGVLLSYKGRGGGFSLGIRPEDITIFRILEIFQGPFRISEHVFRKKPCPNIKKCKLKKRLDAIEKNLAKELKSIDLASLLD